MTDFEILQTPCLVYGEDGLYNELHLRVCPDSEQEAVDTWSRYLSVSVYGAGTSCIQISAYGLVLNFTKHKFKNLTP